MSTASVVALEQGHPHFQSPVDDIESFFWVLLYAVVRNSARGSAADTALKQAFDESREKGFVRFALEGAGYRSLTTTLTNLITQFDLELRKMRRLWNADHNSLIFVKGDADAWILCYQAAALEGLCRVLHLIVGFKEEAPEVVDDL